MRLKRDEQPPVRQPAHPAEQGRNLRRVVGVVLDHLQPLGRIEHDLPTFHARILGEQIGRDGHAEVRAHGQRRRRVEGVEIAAGANPRAGRAKRRGEVEELPAVDHADEAHEELAVETEAMHRGRQAPRRQPGGERTGRVDEDRPAGAGKQRGKRRLEIRDLPVIVGVIPVEVRRDRDLGREPVDCAVALVHLGHDPAVRIRGGGWNRVVLEQPAEQPARAEAGAAQSGDEHAGGGGLAVGADDRDQFPVAEQFGQQFAAPNLRQAPVGRRHARRVIGMDRRRVYQQIGADRKLAGGGEDDSAAFEPRLRGRRHGIVGTRHPPAPLGEQHRQRRHACAAHADEVAVPHGAAEKAWQQWGRGGHASFSAMRGGAVGRVRGRRSRSLSIAVSEFSWSMRWRFSRNFRSSQSLPITSWTSLIRPPR